MKDRNNIVAILAGGTGSRVGGEAPKQFLDIAGKTLLERTIEVFEAHPRVDNIVVVSHPDHIGRVEAIRAKYPGGKWRPRDAWKDGKQGCGKVPYQCSQ